MVNGPLRIVLWIFGSIGVLWLILGSISLFGMGRMMGEGGMMRRGTDSGNGGMMDGGMMDGGMMMGGEGMATMMSMMAAMVLQIIGMLGLVGIFIYLLIDTRRRRKAARATTRSSP